MLKRLFIFGLVTLSLSACATPTSSDPTPSETASPAASSSSNASSTPTVEASASVTAGASTTDPVAAIKALAACVEAASSDYKAVADTMVARADIAKMAMDQGMPEAAQQQYQFVRDAVLNLEKQYGFSCVK